MYKRYCCGKINEQRGEIPFKQAASCRVRGHLPGWPPSLQCLHRLYVTGRPEREVRTRAEAHSFYEFKFSLIWHMVLLLLLSQMLSLCWSSIRQASQNVQLWETFPNSKGSLKLSTVLRPGTAPGLLPTVLKGLTRFSVFLKLSYLSFLCNRFLLSWH